MLFAAVLIIVLVVVALLGFFPGVGAGVGGSSSASYWAGARPIGITFWSIKTAPGNGDGQATIVVKNVGLGPIIITSFKLGTSPTFATSDNTLVIAVNQVTQQVGDPFRVISNDLAITKPCGSAYAVGTRYALNVQFIYKDVNSGGSLTFTGSKPISGTCN